MVGIGSEGGVEPLKAANPSGLKRVSGDNSAGVDAPTLNKLTETLMVDGKIMDIKWLNDLNNDAKLRISLEPPSMASSSKRSNMINELITGIGNMDAENVNSMSSLGAMMCKIMVLMIVATTEQKHIERDSQMELSYTSLKLSKEKASKMMELANVTYKKMMTQAWSNFAQTAAGIGVGTVAARLTAPKQQKDHGVADIATNDDQSGIQKLSKSNVKTKDLEMIDYNGMENARNTYSGFARNLVGVGMNVTQAVFGKEESKMKADIKEKEAMITLIDNLAESAGKGAQSAQKARETFMSLMKQILQSMNSSDMNITRNI
ncbi:MAG: hypothetical protein LBH49_03860 [Puniceicoccales bacterium]|jgi:hypothetical protein|nr:hypothetical protein [Puniceicoccales bacterium]